MGILGQGDEETLRDGLERLEREDFAGITQLQIHVEAIQNHVQALPWDCSNAEVYRVLLSIGVESFASDYPDLALRVLKEWVKFHSMSD